MLHALQMGNRFIDMLCVTALHPAEQQSPYLLHPTISLIIQLKQIKTFKTTTTTWLILMHSIIQMIDSCTVSASDRNLLTYKLHGKITQTIQKHGWYYELLIQTQLDTIIIVLTFKPTVHKRLNIVDISNNIYNQIKYNCNTANIQWHTIVSLHLLLLVYWLCLYLFILHYYHYFFFSGLTFASMPEHCLKCVVFCCTVR